MVLPLAGRAAPEGPDGSQKAEYQGRAPAARHRHNDRAPVKGKGHIQNEGRRRPGGEAAGGQRDQA